jgi:hypothetical protein
MKAINILIFSVLCGGVNAQVGIGTTSPSNDLDVESSSATATAVDINCTGAGDPKINFQLSGTSTFSMGIDNSDADKFKIGTSALETNTRFTIDASGNCGIGNTAPTALLDVDGSAIFNESGAAKNFRVESDNNTAMLYVDGTNDRVGIGTSSPSNILQVGNAGRLRISNGTTDYSLLGTLDSDGSTNTRIVISGNTRSGCAPCWGGAIEYMATASGPHVWYTTDALSEKMRLTSTGYLGIGTSSPSNILQVGNAGRLRIANGTNDYTLLGTQDSDGGTNTRIVLSGNTRGGAAAGFVEYIATNTGAHIWYTTDALSEKMRLTSTGNCGIGNSSPTALLDVDGSAIFNESGAAKNFRVESDNSTAMLYVDGTNDRIGIGTSTPTDKVQIINGDIRFNDNYGIRAQTNDNRILLKSYVTEFYNYGGWISNNQGFLFSNAGGLEFQIGNDGVYSKQKIAIGTTSLSYTLTVNGQPGANGYTAFTNYSDSRLKTNITNLETGALSKILQLRPVQFQYNDKYLQLYPNSDLSKVHKGFIAQEIQKVFPEMVSEMKTSPDSVKYLDLDVSHLQVYLVKALQEQQAIINAQKAEIDALKENALKVAELENKMNAMLLLLNNKQELTVKQ